MCKVIFCYLLEDDVGVTAADTLDGREGEHDVPLAIDVRVHHTQDVLEVGRHHERHREEITLKKMFQNHVLNFC